MGFFRAKFFFHILRFSLNTCNVIFYFLKGNLKFTFQLGFKNKKYNDFVDNAFIKIPIFREILTTSYFSPKFLRKKSSFTQKIAYIIEKLSSTK